ncbi:hypothetical protein KCP76_01635 [Salmonella enterica subsp. enterica serovar Weltevreden]|nr:hypothetical protein KCP76_01635 [Salmonella enterica subsp. enterica serovar Weltevreden]
MMAFHPGTKKSTAATPLLVLIVKWKSGNRPNYPDAELPDGGASGAIQPTNSQRCRRPDAESAIRQQKIKSLSPFGAGDSFAS